jgi:hypothetical protein
VTVETDANASEADVSGELNVINIALEEELCMLLIDNPASLPDVTNAVASEEVVRSAWLMDRESIASVVETVDGELI